MTDKKISELGVITQGDIASGDWVAVVDSSENATKKYNFGDTKTDVTAFFNSTDTQTAGTYVRTLAEGFAYKAVDTATATTVANAGGQAFEVLENIDVDARAFGAVFYDTVAKAEAGVDSTAAIQKMMDAFGYFTLPVGAAKITDTLLIPKNNYGAIYRGHGKETSHLRAVGMVSKSAMQFADQTRIYRLNFRDFRIDGDCDVCLDLTTSFQYYSSEIANLYLHSAAGSSLYIPNGFSYSLSSCDFLSDEDHAMVIRGQVGTNLYNCFAQQAGPGKAGYRIWGKANLYGCNGVNNADIWGYFGASVAVDGFDRGYNIGLFGCNLEEFGTHAIELDFTGKLNIVNTSFIPGPTGTFETLIKGPVSNWNIFSRGCIYASRGATMSGPSRIIHKNKPNTIDVDNIFTDWHETSSGFTYTGIAQSTSNPAFAVSAQKFASLDCDRLYGFVSQVPTTWSVDSTNTDATGRNTLKTANTASTNLKYASGGVLGQRLTIVVQDENTTIQHNQSFSGRFLNTSGADIVASNGDVFTYVNNGTNWVQQ